MTNESNKPTFIRQPEDRPDELREQTSLTQDDMLSDDALHLSTAVTQQPVFSGPGNDAPMPDAGKLQFDDLISSMDSHSSLAGGVLTFDSDSRPGQTIIRVMLDDNGSQQAFEVGVFNGAGMDMNSLLGLISSNEGNHS